MELSTINSFTRCRGRLATSVTSVCTSGYLADQVTITSVGSADSQWQLVPVPGSDAYQLIAANRGGGCLRYLGASNSCGDKRLQLYVNDDGSGLQQWQLTPVKPIYRVPPGPPTIAGPGVVSSTAWSVTWYPGNPGVPAETYSVKCSPSWVNYNCNGPSVGNTVKNIPRGQTTATITGLPPNSQLRCFVIASNAAGRACSTPVTVQTAASNVPPGPPYNVQGSVKIQGNTLVWQATWSVGTAGSPPETYATKCVAAGGGCGDAAQGQGQSNISRSKRKGQVAALVYSTSYNCFVIASNAAAPPVCSAPIPVSTPSAQAPNKPSLINQIVTSTTWSPFWQDGPPVVPTETYKVKCTAFPNTGGCGAAEVGSGESNIPRGEDTGTVKNLQPNVRYICFIVAANGAGTTCSDPIDITTPSNYVAPGRPTNVRLVSSPGNPSSTSVRLAWNDGAKGTPQETYIARCFSLLLGATPACNDQNYAGQSQVKTRGTEDATVTGLSPSTPYRCFILANNAAQPQPVCSDAIDVTTASNTGTVPGPPTNLKSFATFPPYVQETSWRATWTDSNPAGSPSEQYQVVCYKVLLGNTPQCTDPSPSGVSQIVGRGVRDATVTGLTIATAYTCFCKASNSVGDACSSSVNIVTSAG